MSPLAGLRFVVTICATSSGNAGLLHLTARHAFADDGSFASEILAGPSGALPEVQPRGRAELIAEQGESLIFRSDSNGEDLPGYAGAGLYSSVSSVETVLKTVR